MLKVLIFLILILLRKLESINTEDSFVINGILEPNGAASARNNPFTLIDAKPNQAGHLFYPFPLRFKNSTKAEVNSFTTAFILKIVIPKSSVGAHGMTFFISPSKDFGNSVAQFLGLFNKTNNGDPANHIFAVEFDTFENQEFDDINDNHVGVDINSLFSIKSANAGFFNDDDGKFREMRLASGDPIQVWVAYNGDQKKLYVTLSPRDIAKPRSSLFSAALDLSPILYENMYVGFSSSNGRLRSSQSILGWSFKMNGEAQPLNVSLLSGEKKKKTNFWAVILSPIAVVLSLAGAVFIVTTRRRKKLKDVIDLEEVLEDWEIQYGPQRFSYRDLYVATKGFTENELLGKGGFGRVYGGTLLKPKIQIAVKKVAHDSKQGMREFVAEIATIGRLRHPNLVRLLGYCRRKGEFFLVYDFMPNGSLDKFLFDQSHTSLNWDQRYKIINDISSALFYLHHKWAQVVIHRDVKASNILLDTEMNAKLGDFGLAKLCDHGADPQTSNAAGTLGYIAPELARAGKASTLSDMFAFGAFLLEMACGRRPVEPKATVTEIMLVDWVTECWLKGKLLDTVDPRLGHDYAVEEMELVLKLGVLCSQPVASARPDMQYVVHLLRGEVHLPDSLKVGTLAEKHNETTNEIVVMSHYTLPPISFTESFHSLGR